MSNSERIENLKQVALKIEPDFTKLAKIHGAVNWLQEFSFAMQILNGNDFLQGVAIGDQNGFINAIKNVAAIGITLNPIRRLAYLIPRKGKICLDISYLGHIHLAVEAGAILWAKAELVYEKDTYTNNGVNERPTHRFNPFQKPEERGKITGCYVLAKYPNGEYSLTEMVIEDIYDIRSRSESWKAHEEKGKSTPWMTDESEMIKKTVVRRAYKSWPLVDARHRERLDVAAAISGENDPLLIESSVAAETDEFTKGVADLRALNAKLGKDEPYLVDYLTRLHKRTIKTVEDQTQIELDKSLAMLTQIAANPPKKLPKGKNENAR